MKSERGVSHLPIRKARINAHPINPLHSRKCESHQAIHSRRGNVWERSSNLSTGYINSQNPTMALDFPGSHISSTPLLQLLVVLESSEVSMSMSSTSVIPYLVLTISILDSLTHSQRSWSSIFATSLPRTLTHTYPLSTFPSPSSSNLSSISTKTPTYLLHSTPLLLLHPFTREQPCISQSSPPSRQSLPSPSWQQHSPSFSPSPHQPLALTPTLTREGLGIRPLPPHQEAIR